MGHRSIATVRTKQMACSECGILMTVGANKRKAPRHVDCGMEKAAKAAREMSERHGDAYEKWIAASKRRFDILSGGTPPPV